jgi:hypothetical protein
MRLSSRPLMDDLPGRALLLALCALASSPALAAEVVWLDAVGADAGVVAAKAGATGKPLSLPDLRYAATQTGPADDERYAALDQTLEEVRKFETQLDGEKLIMADLTRPIEAIGIVRNEKDKARLFSALAYQGFAVERFFADQLGEDEEAAPYRVEVNGQWLIKPWVRAAAIAPARDVTPYDIAEAPQRIKYSQNRTAFADALPAAIEPVGVPANAQLFVDGEPTPLSASGTVRLPPGLHWVHVTLDGRVIDRWQVDLEPGSRQMLEPSVPDSAWSEWATDLASGKVATPPAALAPALEALGGEVWIASGAGRNLDVWRVTATAAEQVEISVSTPDDPSDPSATSVVVSAGGGWLGSQDLYYQDPSQDASFATVNSAAITVGVSGAYDIGVLRAVAGADVDMTMGEVHEVRFGADGSTPFRLHPYVGAGVQYAQLTVGYMLPHHLAFGARVTVPLVSALELHVTARLGVATGSPPADATWQGKPVATGFGAVAWRF